MTSRVVLVGAFATVLLASPWRAQGKDSALRAVRQRQALSKALPKGTQFTSGGEQYRIVGGLRAVMRAPDESAQETLARAGAGMADLVERKGNHLVFRRTATPQPVAAQVASNQADTLPVAINARTRNFGVVMGSITAHLRDTSAATAVADAHGLKLVLAAPHLAAAFYQVPPGQDIQVLAAALEQDPRVVSAEIEVKEHFDVPQ